MASRFFETRLSSSRFVLIAGFSLFRISHALKMLGSLIRVLNSVLEAAKSFANVNTGHSVF